MRRHRASQPRQDEGIVIGKSATAWLYLAPALIIVLVFTVYPLLMAFRMSFYESYNYYRGVGSGFGLASFRRVLTDPSFHLAVRNTLILSFVAMPVSLLLSLGIAMLINSIKRLQGFFQTVFFLPYVTSVIAVGIVFRWLFHSNYGLFNYLLGFIGIDPIGWLNSPKTAIWALSIYSIWSGLAFRTIIFLVGLQNIPKVYYNAARIDGAGRVKTFFRITLPLLSPTMMFLIIVSMINSLKTYNEVYALFGEFGGPVSSAYTIVFYIYRTFYGAGRMHIAAAAAVLLFIAILLLTILQLRISKKLVHYR